MEWAYLRICARGVVKAHLFPVPFDSSRCVDREAGAAKLAQRSAFRCINIGVGFCRGCNAHSKHSRYR